MYVYNTFFYVKFFRASGKAILGTERYFYVRSQHVVLDNLFNASGEAVAGAQRHLEDANPTLGTQR